MDWLHVFVLFATLFVICVLGYSYERLNAASNAALNRIRSAGAVCLVIMIAAGFASDLWQPVDMFAVAGFACFGLAWRLRIYEDLRLTAIAFGTAFMAGWTMTYEMSSSQQFFGLGMALSCGFLMGFVLWAWQENNNHDGHLVAVTY